MSKPLRLDLGCGRNKKGPEWIGIDISSKVGADIQLDFGKQRLPFPDESVDQIRAYHSLEHITKSELIFLMNECWRVLKWSDLSLSDFDHTGKMWILVPSAWTNSGQQDPTHKNFFVKSSLKFFCGDYLIKHKLDYGINSAFFEYKDVAVEYPCGRAIDQKQYCTTYKFSLLKSKEHHNKCKNRFPFNIKDTGKAIKAEAQTQLPVHLVVPAQPTRSRASRCLSMHDPEWFLNTRWKTEHNMDFSDTTKRIAKHAINKHMGRIIAIKVDASLRYGENSAPGGAQGLLSDLRRKFTRIEGFFKHNRQSTTENIIDTLFDNAVYSILAVMAIEEGKIEEIAKEKKDD